MWYMAYKNYDQENIIIYNHIQVLVQSPERGGVVSKMTD